MAIRRIPFQGVLNFRDVGGYPVRGGGATRWGAVYRSGLRGPCGIAAETITALREALVS